MKFIKGIGKGFRIDGINGILKNIGLMISPYLLGGFFYADFLNRIRYLENLGRITRDQISFADCWLYVYGGMQKYDPSTGVKFEFPATWMLLFLLGTFLVLNYPFKNLDGIGQHVLVAINGRSEWWLAKCFWNVISTVYYHGGIILTLLLLCRMSGIAVKGNINYLVTCILFNIMNASDMIDGQILSIEWLLLPLCVAIAVNLFQMLLGLFIKPLFAFLVMAVMFLVSAYLFVPWLPGNYTMAIRGSWLYRGGMEMAAGYGWGLGLILISIIVGLVKFKRYYDILGRE